MNYYIQGNTARADQIKAAFKKKGYDIPWPDGCTNPAAINIGVERNGAKYVVAETSEYIKDIIKTHPDYKELELPVEPKFKAKDRIVNKSDKSTIYRIIALHEGFRKYIVDIEHKVSYESCPWIAFEDQDDYELAPKPHYDISNFKPFDKVLVKDSCCEKWVASLFSNYDKDCIPHHFVCIDSCYEQCIPFNDDTKHLLGTTDMPSEEYINW